MQDNYYEQKLGKTQAQVDLERRNAERRARSESRKAAKSAGMAALGGQTLSEALRGTTSTKQRRAIKDAYEGAKTKATDPFASKSSNNLKPIGKGSLMAQSVTIVVDGVPEEIDIIVGQ
jgi:hypothetical protein